MAWEKLPPYKGEVNVGCVPVENGMICGVKVPADAENIIAPLETQICVGFGAAQVTRDGDVIYDQDDWGHKYPDKDYPTLHHFEIACSADPDHDYQAWLFGPTSGRVYQRQDDGVWVLVRQTDGFA